MSVELLSKVEYSNLLSINWNEQKIQTNFRLIVDALGMQQQTTSSLQAQIDKIREEMSHVVNKTENKVQTSMKEVLAPAVSSKSIAPQPSAESNDKLLTDLAKEIQKKMAEKQKDLINDVNSLKNQMDRLKNTITGLMSQQTEKQPSQKIIDVPSRKSIYEPAVAVPPAQTGPTQNDLDEINRKIASMLEDIGRISQDSIRTNAKINIQEQNLDSLKKVIESYGGNIAVPVETTIPTTTIPNSISNKKLQTEEVRRPSIKTRPSKITVASVKDITNQQNKPETQDFRVENLQSQLNSLLLDMGTLKFCYQQLKLLIGDSRRSEQKRGNKLDSLFEKHQSLKQKVELERDRVDRQFKNIMLAMSQMTTVSEPQASETQQKQELLVQASKPPSPSSRADQRNTVSGMRNSRRDSDSAKINERIGKLHALMVNSVTLSQFDRLKSELNDRLAEINKILQSQLPEIKDQIADINALLRATDEKLTKQINRVQDDTQKVFTAVGERAAATDKKINVSNSRIEQLKKDIQYMKEDLEYYKNNLMKTEPTEAKTVGKEEEIDKSSIEMLKRKMEDMKKQYTNKIHDLRTELIGAIRDFQKKMASKSTNDQEIGQLQERYEEIKLYLSKKADLEDTKKSLLYLDKKLSVVLSSLTKEDESTEDARAAKKNWFCLSCDKVLEGYSGKVGRHIPWDALSPKNIMKVTQISTTMRIDDKKRKDPLPTLGSSLKK